MRRAAKIVKKVRIDHNADASGCSSANNALGDDDDDAEGLIK